MPRSPLRKTEACKASVTHPGPWEEFSKARHGLISAQSFTQGCPRPVASLPRSALSPCHPPCVFSLFIRVFFEAFSTRLPAASGDEPRWAGICLLGKEGGGAAGPATSVPDNDISPVFVFLRFLEEGR